MHCEAIGAYRLTYAAVASAYLGYVLCRSNITGMSVGVAPATIAIMNGAAMPVFATYPRTS